MTTQTDIDACVPWNDAVWRTDLALQGLSEGEVALRLQEHHEDIPSDISRAWDATMRRFLQERGAA